MTDLADLISAGDAWDSQQASLPLDTGQYDFTSMFANVELPTFDGPLVPPVLNLPSTPSGIGDMFRNLAQLVQVGYQGEALVQQQKFRNKIANAQLENQLETVRTAPNLWLVLGLGGAALLFVASRDKR